MKANGVLWRLMGWCSNWAILASGKEGNKLNRARSLPGSQILDSLRNRRDDLPSRPAQILF